MNKVLFLDILTTGSLPQRCGIYAIGGSLCEDHRDSMKELCRFEFRMRPFENARISDNSLWLGGVTRSQLLYYKKEDEVLKAFTGILSEAVKLTDPSDKIFICGFNTSAFDLPFLKEWFERNSDRNFRNYFHMQTMDLMTLSAYALMDERTTMKEFNLDTVARKMGIMTKTSETYCCADNVQTSISVYRKLKEKLGRGEWGTFSESDKELKNF